MISAAGLRMVQPLPESDHRNRIGVQAAAIFTGGLQGGSGSSSSAIWSMMTYTTSGSHLITVFLSLINELPDIETRSYGCAYGVYTGAYTAWGGLPWGWRFFPDLCKTGAGASHSIIPTTIQSSRREVNTAAGTLCGVCDHLDLR